MNEIELLLIFGFAAPVIIAALVKTWLVLKGRR